MREVLNIQDYKISLTNQIVEDLTCFKISNNLETDYKLGQYFDSRSSISGKTIQRILSRETNLPPIETVYQIYSTIFGTDKYDEIMEKAPRVISKFITDYSNKGSIRRTSTVATNRYLHESQLAMKLYYKCCGHGISLEEIRKKHGEDGINEIKKMEEFKIVKIDSESMVKLGSYSFVVDIESHGKVTAFLANSFYRPGAAMKKGGNFIFNRCESVSPNAYGEMIGVLEDAVAKLGKIIKKDDLEKNTYQQTEKFCLSTFIDKIE